LARSFVIVANGFADGPAQALRDYLVGRDADVVTILHPLASEQGTKHVVTRQRSGREVERRTLNVPLRPPLSFGIDPFVPLRVPTVDAWFGFNPLACARGLIARRLSRAQAVFLWSVDFVPDRFGPRNPLTGLYDRLDAYCCTHADARIELSAAARESRNGRHRLQGSAAAARVVPMGAWLDRVPTTPPDGVAARRVVFLGHLVSRMGVESLLDALALLQRRGDGVEADVIGTGPLEASLRARAASLGLEATIRFHGFVRDHRAVEGLLAQASVAAAPYRPDTENFTRFADPGKLKTYLAAGLPVLLTDVPPNAAELTAEAGAEIVAPDAGSLAEAIRRVLASPDEWRRRRSAALTYVRRFDWARLLPDLFLELGLGHEPRNAATPRAKPPR
jgi:glycosyltransferase involved in cell wall biosynthesis